MADNRTGTSNIPASNDPIIDIPMTDAEREAKGRGPKGNRRLAAFAWDCIKAARSLVQKHRKEALEADRFAAGHHFTKSLEEKMDEEGRPHAAFNAAQKWLRFVGGIEEQAQITPHFLPSDIENPEQAKAGELVGKAYEWAMRLCGGGYERNRAFMDMLRRGMGWTETVLDRSIEVRGRVILRRIDGHEMLWDTDAVQGNLEDTRWRARERVIGKREAMRRFPDHAATIYANVGQSSTQDGPSETTLINEHRAVPVDEAQWPSVGKDKVKITEFQWYEEVVGVYFVDPLDGKEDWLAEDEFKKYESRYTKLLPRLRAMQPEQPLPDKILSSPQFMREYKRMILIGQDVVWGPFPLPGNRFSFNCLTGQWDDEMKVWYGFFKLLIDPQKYMTKFINQTMEIMLRSAKGGVVIEESAVPPGGLAKFESTWARTGGVNVLADGGIEKFKEKTQATVPAGSFEMMKTCVQMLSDVTGINPESAMGMGSGDVPMVTLHQRQLAAQILLSQEFAAADRYLDSEARTVFAYLKFIADDRWIRVGGPFDGQALQLTKAPFFLEYDIVLDKVSRDPYIREQWLQTTKDLAPTLFRTGNFPPSIIQLLPLPEAVKRDIRDGMKAQSEKQQQMALAGLNTSGRGKIVGVAEVQAKVAKVRADTALAVAKAQSLQENLKQSKGKMLLDMMIKQEELELTQQHQQAQNRQAAVSGASQEALGMAQVDQRSEQAGMQAEQAQNDGGE